ncbi:MAG: SLC13 family permease [Oscillospiraceae bacterium]|nr:SLC13 family permease [Oscillospiraceae bacterium]
MNLRIIIQFIKKEIILTIAIVLAIISMIFVHPNTQYFSYIDFSVLGILFCLMVVVAGFMELGIFDFISARLIIKSKSVKLLVILLVNCVFFFSMLVTNDVVLIAFVPITIGIFNFVKQEKLIFIIVIETIAANIGSMLTPIGNPQNLYMYSFYHMDILDFLKIVVPVGVIGYLIIMCLILASKNGNIEFSLGQKTAILDQKPMFLYYACLFILCILAVMHTIDYKICVIIVLISIIIFNQKLLKKVDYGLLLTFVSFFIFVGNIERVNAIKTMLSFLVNGKAFILSVLSCQIISNVPAAMMITRFTNDARSVLVGVNIGGIGTPVASLASLISFKLYSKSNGSMPIKYLKVFIIYNVPILLFLTVIFFYL